MSTESQWHGEDPLSLPARRSRWPYVLLFIVILALAGGAGAYAWMNLDQLMDFVQGKPAEAKSATGDDAMMTDLLAAQQKTNEDLATLERRIAEQQQQLKDVTDQLADVTAKLGALRGAAPPPQAPLPQMPLPAAPTPPPIASTQPPAPARAAPRPKQPPRPARPAPASGPISVGGAPLNATAAPGTR